MSLSEAISKHFNLGPDKASLIQELAELASQNNLDGFQLSQKWELYAMRSQLLAIGNGGPKLAEIPEFGNSLRLSSTTPKRYTKYTSSVTPSRTVIQNSLATPSRLQKSQDIQHDIESVNLDRPSIAKGFGNRETWEGSGTLKFSLHKDWGNANILNKTVTVKLLNKEVESKSRYMTANIGDIALSLDEHISSRAINLHHALQDSSHMTEEASNLENPSRPHQTPFLAVGRICSSEENLTPNNVVLEPALASLGNRVALDLSSLTSYSIFPGQIVGVEGVNPTGQEMRVSRLVPGTLPSPNPNQYSGMRIVVACGPFTTDNNLQFSPLTSLLAQIQELDSSHSPSALILVGPFLSEEHPTLQSGVCPDIKYLFGTMFCSQLARFKSLCPEVQIVLVPSTFDWFHPHIIIPQPALPANLGLAPGLVCNATNPGRFSFITSEGCIEILCPSFDILSDLANSELVLENGSQSKGSEGSEIQSSTLGRLSQHILLQSHLYPIYPHNNDIDTARLKELSFTHLPHILILPSSLPCEAQSLVSDQIVTINPGRLANGNRGGSYAAISINEFDQSKTFASQCQVEIFLV